MFFSLFPASYITLCKRDQNTIDKCAKEAVEKLRPKLIEGIPELDVPSIEPFYIPEVSHIYLLTRRNFIIPAYIRTTASSHNERA